ncbi:hypothetical protein ACHAQJ_000053 [Trichoderma viride]
MFDEYSIPEDYHFFTFFERSIGDVNQGVTQCLRKVLQDIHKAKEQEDAWRIIDMNVSVETDLFVEIEDVQEELHILSLVLIDQQSAITQLSDIIDAVKSREAGLASPRKFDSNSIAHRLKHIKVMQEIAQKARDTVSLV